MSMRSYLRKDSDLLTSDTVQSITDILPSEEEDSDSEIENPTPASLDSYRLSYKSNNFIVFPQEKQDRSYFTQWWHRTAWPRRVEKKQARSKNGKTLKLLTWGSEKRSASLWRQFDEIACERDGRPMLRCTVCLAHIAHPTPSDNGTGSMQKHVYSKPCKQSTRTEKPRLSIFDALKYQATDKKGAARDLIYHDLPIYTPENHQKELIDLVVAMDMPLQASQVIALQRYTAFLKRDAAAHMPGRTRFTDIFKDQFLNIQGSLLPKLGSSTKISLAVDVWQSDNKLSFIAIIAYYVNEDWLYCESLIGFEPIRGTHSGESMAKIVFEVLSKFELEKRLFAVTGDNASDNRTLLKALEKLLAQRGYPWNPDIYGLPCMAHVIQLAAEAFERGLRIKAEEKDILNLTLHSTETSKILDELTKKVDSIDNTIKKIRFVARITRSSAQRNEEFKAIQRRNGHTPLALIQDVKTRWNSKHDMLERALKLRNTISMWLVTESTRCKKPQLAQITPTDCEWDRVNLIVKLTEPFKIMTKILSRITGPGIHDAFRLYNRLLDVLEEAQRSPDIPNHGKARLEVKQAIQSSIAKIQKYYDNTDKERGDLYSFAAILNPTKKLYAFSPPHFHSEWQNFYRKRFTDYVIDNYSQIPTTQNSPQPISGSNSLSSHSATVFDMFKDNQNFDLESDPTADIERELNIYFNTKPCKPGDSEGSFKILSWWKANEETLPILTRMAKDIFGTAVTEVGCERAFTIGRDIISYRRCSLSGEMIKRLVISKHYLRQRLKRRTQVLYPHLFTFTAGSLEDALVATSLNAVGEKGNDSDSPPIDEEASITLDRINESDDLSTHYSGSSCYSEAELSDDDDVPSPSASDTNLRTHAVSNRPRPDLINNAEQRRDAVDAVEIDRSNRAQPELPTLPYCTPNKTTRLKRRRSHSISQLLGRSKRLKERSYVS